jgi:glycosyltransferase involved in cell wall biosynthesis
MRILHLVHQYAPDFVGGTELYTQTLATHQTAVGHEVAVFYPALTDAAWPQPQVVDGVRVYGFPLGVRGRTAVFAHTYRQPKLADGVRAVLAAEQPDVVHVQHLMGLPLAALERILAPHRYVVTLHDYWFACANAQLITNTDETICAGPDKRFLNCARCALARGGQPLVVAPVLAPTMAYRNGRLRRILQQAQAVITPTHFVRQTYGQMGFDTSHFVPIPHGIALPAAMPPRVLHEGLHVGYVGGIAPQKGVHILVAAANGLPVDGRLTIYGDLTAFPDYVAELRRLAQHPGITFAGALPHAQLWAALAALDVVVAPTLWYETASLIVQEAFAAGAPVVASRIGVLPERVREGVDGLLFAPGDVRELTAVLQQLAAHPEELARLRANIAPVFTIEQHLAAVLDVYGVT